ncbi:hypothetical protein HPP92_027464 [Vanilla planifolia]|uniref:Uncharacterized protein n=1 Tax=Vanilla planifolia TaxID=51239 RepID=A0A835P8Z2_VANPL|nr:hypothetical protein HPP92_027464 [Vanilla planifolia]
MSLIACGELGGRGDLPILVFGEYIEAIVVDADAIVRVSGRDGDLEADGEEIGEEEVGVGGEVELVDGAVLEEEFGLCWAKDEPDHEDDEEDQDDEAQQTSKDPADNLLAVVGSVLSTILFRHRIKMRVIDQRFSSPETRETRMGNRGSGGELQWWEVNKNSER